MKTIENRSIPRNRGLANIFHDIGFIEGWGTGFQRMVEGCSINGNPKPELKEIAGAFVVKFTRRPASEGKGGGISGGVNGGISEGTNGGANEGISQLIEFIRKNPGKRVVEIAAVLNIPSKTIERWIKKLREQREIRLHRTPEDWRVFCKRVNTLFMKIPRVAADRVER